MDKNTIWAIVLSTLVIIGSLVITPLFMDDEVYPQTVVETEEVVEEKSLQQENANEIKDEMNILSETSEFAETEVLKEEIIEFKLYDESNENVIADIKFTTKGGDIISYKLNEHTDAGIPIEMSDNITDNNRTLSLSFGKADNPVINDIFSYEINNNVITFRKNFTKTNSDGSENSFILEKKYSFHPGEYLFKLDVNIFGENDSGLNYNGAAYTIRTSPQIGPDYDPKKDKYEYRRFQAYNGKKVKDVILSPNLYKSYDKDLIWAGITGKYFIELIIPTDVSKINGKYYSTLSEDNSLTNAQALIERKAISGKNSQDTYYLYFGPRTEKYLEKYNVSEKNPWNFGGNRITSCLSTGGFLSPLEAVLKFCLEQIQKVFKNWGVTIIILTILLKLLMFPLSKKQSLGTLKMQQLQPKIQLVQQKYADDKQKMQIEMSKIYQEAKYNPASGCLPMLLQFLILFSMYNLFNNYFEFRGHGFIEGWIPDLTKGDSVYIFNFNIPLLGNELRLLPIIYVISQLLFGKITNNGGMSTGQTGMTMKFMTYGMPIMFFFIFYNAPSGLLLYWITSNIFQMGQQIVINEFMKKKRQEMNLEEKPVQKTLPPKAKKKK